MISPEIPHNEEERLRALKEYSILDTLPEKDYDSITFLASYICETPISLISLVDEKRQWFKSKLGLEVDQTPREIAFCAHAINNSDNILIVPDSRLDERFKDNPLVTDHPNVVFYAGIPLTNPDGYSLGTLCVIDNKPHDLDQTQIKALNALSKQLMNLMELRKKTAELKTLNRGLEEQNKALYEFARKAAHDIKSPINSIIMFTDLILSDHLNSFDHDGKEYLQHILSAGQKLTKMIDGILEYSLDSSAILRKRVDVDIVEVLNETIRLVGGNNGVSFKITAENSVVFFTNKVAIQQIFSNLLTNSIKYNNKSTPEITISISRDIESLKIIISDNGPGIKEEDLSRIFNLFETTENKDKDGRTGSGIGLATVKSLVESLNGQITVSSEIDKGTAFEIRFIK